MITTKNWLNKKPENMNTFGFYKEDNILDVSNAGIQGTNPIHGV
jgi:hypothetical protein